MAWELEAKVRGFPSDRITAGSTSRRRTLEAVDVDTMFSNQLPESASVLMRGLRSSTYVAVVRNK